MLSFDFSDKQIRVVKGELVGGKIKIAGAMVIDLPSGVIINGFIQELSKLVSIVNEQLIHNKFTDKEAVISLSSSQIVFRELKVPKAKGNQLFAMVKNQMQSDMGVSDDYNITYTVVGEAKEDNMVVNKILAAACPNDMIIGIKRMFNMLSLPLKSISINCNCISRIVLADPRNKDKMPLLAVQIDDNFLNLNLYENNQLAFSRVVPIDKEDYGGIEDYVYQALNENVFRMIQFNKARGGIGIKDVIFYGNVSDYIKLTRSIEQQDVKTNILAVPNQIVGYEKFEFAAYANAIGAMLKGKKDTEKTNLLEVDSAKGREQVTNGFYKTLIAAFVITAAMGVAGYFGLDYYNNSIKDQTQTIQDEIESPKNKKSLKELASADVYFNKLKTYYGGVDIANQTLASNKVLTQDVFDEIIKQLNGKAKIGEIVYKPGELHIKFIASDKNYPATMVENLHKCGKFAQVLYYGIDPGRPTDKEWEFEVTICLKNAPTNAEEAGETK